MLSNIHTFTPAGKIKKPLYSTVATWVKEFWNEVDVSLIQKSFRCCGISTKLDGSEDNQLFNYGNLLDQVNNMDDKVEEDPNPEEEYSEASDYKNNWDVENNNKVDSEIIDSEIEIVKENEEIDDYEDDKKNEEEIDDYIDSDENDNNF